RVVVAAARVGRAVRPTGQRVEVAVRSGAALAVKGASQVALSGNDGALFHLAFAHGAVEFGFTQELGANLGHGGQAVGAHYPIGQADLAEQRVLEGAGAAGNARRARHVEAADDAPVGFAHGE